MIIKNIKYYIKSIIMYIRINRIKLKFNFFKIIKIFKAYFIRFFISLKSIKTLVFFIIWSCFYTSNWLSKVITMLVPWVKIPIFIAVPLYFLIIRLLFYILNDITKYIDSRIKKAYWVWFDFKNRDKNDKNNNINKYKDIKTQMGIYGLYFYSLRPYIMEDMLKLGLNLEKYNLLLDELNLIKKEMGDMNSFNSPSKYSKAIYNISLEKESLMDKYDKLKEK